MENNSQENPDKEFKNLHGFEGLLHVEGRGNKIHEISQSAIVAAMNLGIPYNNDFNGAKQNGVGKYQVYHLLKVINIAMHSSHLLCFIVHDKRWEKVFSGR